MCKPMTSSCSIMIMTLCNCFAVKSVCVVVFCLLLLFEIVVLSSIVYCSHYRYNGVFLCVSLADVLVLLTLIHRHISNAAPACSLVLYVIFLGLKLVLLIIV